MGTILYPEIFLTYSDKYISTLIEYLVTKKKYKRVTGLVGYLQSASIEKYLRNRSCSHLAIELTPTKIKHTKIADITVEEIVEKHSIIDVLMNGINILNDIESIDFSTTHKMINLYADPSYTDPKKK